MKKTLFASVLLMSATAFAQTGKVGLILLCLPKHCM